MVRNGLCQNVDLSKMAEGGFRQFVEPSLETKQSSGGCTLGNNGRVWERVSVMEVHTICDEKSTEARRDEVHWFELDLVDRADDASRNGSQPSIQFWRILRCNRGL